MAKNTKNRKQVAQNLNVENVSMATATPTEVKVKTDKSKDHGFRVVETVMVSPAELTLTDKFRGRVKPVNDEVLVDRADSIRRHGQQQPIQARRNAEGQLEVIFGNTRTLAGQKLFNGYTNAEGREVRPDPNFKLRVEVVDVDDETAFLRNVVENAQRSQTNPIDNAVNQQILRDQYGMSDAMITKHYGYASQASVTRLKKLLQLEEEYQNAVSDGTLTQGAAFQLADVEPSQRQAVWLKAVDRSKGEDSVSTGMMVQAIKEVKKEAKEAAEANGTQPEATTTGANTTQTETAAEPAGPGRPKSNATAMTLKEFKDLCGEIAADPACPPVVEQAMGMILSTVAGKVEPGDFAKWFRDNLIGGNNIEEPAVQPSAEDSFDPAVNPRAGDEPAAE